MRVLALIDMDSFYTQVEVKRNPSLKGRPVVVIQYNPYGDLRTLRPNDNRIFPESNGSIIASSYEARKYGVKRNMMAQAAKKLCPELQIVQVPVAHGKADLTIYREAGAQVINVLSNGAVCERASIDEAYLDVTAAAQQLLTAAAVARDDGTRQQQQGEPAAEVDDILAASVAADGDERSSILLPLPDALVGWHVTGQEPAAAGVTAWWQQSGKSQDDQLLAAGAVVVARLRAAVADQLGFSCSAGIAHSKILAKLGAGLNKPAQQTLVPAAAVADLLNPLPISKLRALGGKFGEEIATSLGIQTVGELAAVPVSRLESLVGEENAAWLARLAQGIDDLEVKPRTLPKSISCGKTFRGANAITGLSAVHKWLQELGKELQERIEADRKDHQRLPGLLTVSIDTLSAGAATTAAAAGTGAAAAAAVAAAVGAQAAAAVAANGGRHTAQTWRAGAVNVSRSCNLRRPVAEVMAEDALKLVKKWARDRGQGWKIIGMFISASNFVAAPTGASTLERFMAAAGKRQQQQQQGGAGPDTADPDTADDQAPDVGGQAGTKQSATAAGLSGGEKLTQVQRSTGHQASGGSRRGKKRTYGDLRGFLTTSTAASAAAAAAGSSGNAGLAADETLASSAMQQQQQRQQQQSSEQLPPDDADGVVSHHDDNDVVMVDVPEQISVTETTPGDRHSSVATPNAAVRTAAQQGTAAAAAPMPAPRVRSVMSALGSVKSTSAQQAVNEDQPNQQQQEEEVELKDDSSPHADLQPSRDTAAAAAAAATATVVSGSQSQSSLPSQVVQSLGDWLDANHHHQQQQQEQQLCSHHQSDTEQQQQYQQQANDFAFKVPKQPPNEHLQQHTEAQNTRDTAAALSEPTATTNIAAATPDHQQQQQQLRMSDIDPAVFAELPFHIQAEIRRAAGERVGGLGSSSSNGAHKGKGRSGGSSSQKQQQQNKTQQSGSIARYFCRSK